MASFQEHVDHAAKNLRFLQGINEKVSDSMDWQVTVSFYVVVHLANAHITATENQHFRTHNEVKISLNPFNKSSPSRIDDAPYLAYSKLRDLSRRSRYLISDDMKNTGVGAFLIHEIHLAKSLRHLETFLNFFSKKYNVSFPKIQISCNGLKQHEVSNFIVT